jgi:hypothetical protein
MALSKSEPRANKDDEGISLPIASAAQMYGGALAQIRNEEHATSQGDVAPYNDEVGAFFAGVCQNEALGTASLTPEARLSLSRQILDRATVTGVASAADILKAVYATDDNVMTLTKPTNGEVIGVVIKWYTSTTCDVLLLDPGARIAADTRTEVIYLGTLDFSTVADGDLRTAFPAPFHGEFLEFFGMVSEALVGAGGTILVNLEIATTNVTGGVVTMSTAAGGTLGAKLAGTAITAAAVFHEGEAIDIEGASAGGTRTSGKLELYAKVIRKPGA